MCKTPCCRPQHSSGTGELIAMIAAIIIAADVLSALLHLLVILLLIVLISSAALAVISLVTWALIRRHRRTTPDHHAAVLVRRAPALPPRYLRVIEGQPTARLPGTTPPGRALTAGDARLARQRSDAITTYDDRVAVEDLIRILRGHHT